MGIRGHGPKWLGVSVAASQDHHLIVVGPFGLSSAERETDRGSCPRRPRCATPLDPHSALDGARVRAVGVRQALRSGFGHGVGQYVGAMNRTTFEGCFRILDRCHLNPRWDRL